MTERPSPSETKGVPVTPVASTPSSLLDVASRDTLLELEFPEALAVVAAHAVSELGAARVRVRRPTADEAWIRRELQMVRQLRDLLLRDDPFRPEPVSDLSETLARLAVPGSVLEGPWLAELGRALGAMRTVERELRRVSEAAPSLAALLANFEPTKDSTAQLAQQFPKDLERNITRALDPDGTVRDEASPAVRRARERLRETRSRLIRLLEDLTRTLEPEDRSADSAVTVRNGRYVVSVRRDARSRLKGIVHGESGSGATLFVEPQEAVELANELSACEAEEARAVLQVLRDLTEQARTHREAIAAGFAMCIAADDLYARARYAAVVGGVEPTIHAVNAVHAVALPDAAPAAMPLVMRQARHPLLLAKGINVVPFDLTLDADRSVIVISGPNTGGKTVLLKAVGLIAALAQSGVIPPVGEGTRLPVFRRIFSEIGDHQSIAADLSTFSAHVQRLRDVLTGADASSLVLVDEIGNGTDPVEGAALAGAILLELAKRGATTVVTTHLTQLKDLAARSPGMENGSLAFGAETLTPTYRLLQGTPGRSYGLAVAGRLGLPAPVLQEAEALLPEAERSLDALLADAERRAQELEQKAADLANLEARLAAQREVLSELQQQLADKERELKTQGVELERAAREQARAFLLEARRRVEEALALARAAVTEATAREARRLVEEGVKREAEALKKLDDVAKRKGWMVRVGKGKGEMGKGKGEMGKGVHPAPAPQKPGRSPNPSLFPFPVSPQVDLRGLSADEAEAALVAAIDGAIVAELPYLRIIHGRGTGALRARVQQVLAGDRRIQAFRLSDAQEGGTGVTIVEFRP